VKGLYKKFTVLVLFTIVSIGIGAQNERDLLVDSITNNFVKQSMIYPQEKIYAQIDKPYYITGENIWFKAYLVDSKYHIPDTTSRYVYAELINPVDTLVRRVKIRPVKGVYKGYFDLPEDLPEGTYQMRFYTRFMEGLGEEYYFRRTVYIGDPLTALYRTVPKFEYKDNGKVDIELYIVDLKENVPIRPDKIQTVDKEGEPDLLRVNKENIIKLSTKAPAKGEKKSVYIEYDYGGKFHKEFIPIPHQSDYEVSFLPEGGHNIAGTVNRIAVKALNAEGLGEDIEGFISNARGDTLTEFKTTHQGMTNLSLMLTGDSIYYAVCRNSKGLVKKYQLPVAVRDQLALQVHWQRDRYAISVRSTQEDFYKQRSLYLLIQSRNRLLHVIKWNNEFATIPKKLLPTGVCQLLLIDSDMNPLSERLIFNINDNETVKADFVTDKANYTRRELIKGKITLADVENNPQIASLSVSITDDKDIKPDSCVNILSSLLLTSELKGYIESPAWYFRGVNNDKMLKLDLLMMTQGWSRYNVGRMLKGDFDKPKSYLELGQFISGTVKGGFFMNKKGGGYPVTLMSSKGGIFDQTFTDDDGKFSFQGFEAADSTGFVVQGTTKKGGKRVELIIDPELFPKSKYSLPYTFPENRQAFESYIGKADQNFIMANGMRMIYLKDIEIVGQKGGSESRSAFSSPMNPRMTAEQIDKQHPQTIYDILRNFAGVMVMGDRVSIRGSQNPPLIVIDDVQYDGEFNDDILATLPVNDIEEIELIKDGMAAMFGSRGGNGVILITTKRGEVNFNHIENFNIKAFTPLGYQTSKEFYSPQYATKEQRDNPNPDLRTTLYWNPDLKTGEDGSTIFDFYTSDAATTYSVVIEGVTRYGLLIYSVKKITVKD